jgi:NAD(P)-dependent dehydrogenase (short-subunit alcohol dehydrogenase family)
MTGGSRGMGEAEALLFAAEDATVVVADILGSDAETAAADISVGGGRPRRSTLRLQLGLGDQTFFTDRGFGSMGLLEQQAV